MMADLDATDDDADKSEKWRRVVHSNDLSGLKMDDGRWLKWALRDR